MVRVRCNMPIGSARRDLSNGGIYVELHGYHGAQQIFARSSPASWAQRGQISTLGLPGTPLATEHFATIGGHVGSEVGLSPIAKMSSSPNPDLKMLLQLTEGWTDVCLVNRQDAFFSF